MGLTLSTAAGAVLGLIPRGVWIALLILGVVLMVGGIAEAFMRKPRRAERREDGSTPRQATARGIDGSFADWLGRERERGLKLREEIDPPKGYLTVPGADMDFTVLTAQIEKRVRAWARAIRRRLGEDAPRFVVTFDKGPDLPPPHLAAGVIGTATREQLRAFVDGKLAALDQIIGAQASVPAPAEFRAWLDEKIREFQRLRTAADEQAGLPVPILSRIDRIDATWRSLDDEIGRRLQLSAPEWLDLYDEDPEWRRNVHRIMPEQFAELSRCFGWKADRLADIRGRLS